MVQHYIHGGVGFAQTATKIDLEQVVNNLSLTVVGAASVGLVILVTIVILLSKHKKAWNHYKAVLFFLISAIVACTTLTISGATVYLNVKSAAGGPVHWHADIEYWACGNELELRDPHGVLSNKIGTPTLHEHDDKRIHLEGVPIDLPEDASLGKFMRVVGGEITRDSFVLPLNDDKLFENSPSDTDGDGNGAPAPEDVQQFIVTGRDGQYAKLVTGQKCGDKTAAVQTFVYQYNDQTRTYTQRKLADPANYAIGRHSNVPPGDCIIVEFAPPKDRTDKLCKQYGIHDTSRCESFGVKANERKICDSKEIR